MLGELAGVRLYSVWEVPTEACHLLNDKSRINMLRWAAAGRLTLLSSDPAELSDMADYMVQYEDGGADLADVALVLAADRIGVHAILTVDRRDFDRYLSPKGVRLRRLWLKD